jgi:alpha-mannosidase
VRRAEHLLAQVELATAGSADDSVTAARVRRAWEHVCLHQFHDILCGTCIPSAYRACEDQVAAAAAVGDEALRRALRRRYPALGADPLQRIVALNASDSAYDGYAECEPWLDWRSDEFALLDEQGHAVPWQRMQREAAFLGSPRVLCRLRVAPGEVRQLRLAPVQDAPMPQAPARIQGGRLANGQGVLCDGMHLNLGDVAITPRLDLLEDGTDTWSHGIDRYPEGPVVASDLWHNRCVVDSGPLMAASVAEGRIGSSGLKAEWRVYAEEAFAELLLRVHWAERRKLLKLCIAFPCPATAGRRDGTMDTSIARPNNGAELPLRDWTLIELDGGLKLGIVAPDVYALDANAGRVRLTLLRSPIMAHHEPHRGHFPREVFSDQGVHEFRFRFFLANDVVPGVLEHHARMLQRPLVFGDLTAGMPAYRQ